MNRVFASFLFLISTLNSFAALEPDLTGMELSIHQWCQNIEAGWNLGNSLEAAPAKWDNKTWTYYNIDPEAEDRNTWEFYGAWNPYTTQAMIDSVRAAGFNAVRIPVRWFPHVVDQETMEIDSVWMNRVKEVVGYCLNNDMYVLLNTHHENWLESNPYYDCLDKTTDMLTKLWTNIAYAFADYDGRLAFAGLNEVHEIGLWSKPTAECQSVVNTYNQTFVDAVRATGGRNYYRNLFIQPYACKEEYAADNTFVIPQDVVKGRLGVEFHYYSPYEYCNSCKYYYWGDKYKVYGTILKSKEADVEKLMNNIQARWWDKGLGVIVGEYGCSNHFQATATAAKQQIQLENIGYYYETVTANIRKHGFGGFVWDNNDRANGPENYGIFNRVNDMEVAMPYVLDGIMTGAAQLPVNPDTAYVAPEEELPYYMRDYYARVGKKLWEGDEILNFSEGLQLKLAASNFSKATPDSHLVIYFTYDSVPARHEIQLFTLKWKKDLEGFDFYAEGVRDSSHVYFYFTEDMWRLDLTIPESALNIIKRDGLIIQGTGASMQCVVLVDSKSIDFLPGDVDSNGRVDIGDVVLVQNHLKYNAALPNAAAADIVYNGLVTPVDLETITGIVLKNTTVFDPNPGEDGDDEGH